MADDRLDDAIDAVVRAVDRIERATRAAAPEPQPLGDATRPIQGAVGSTQAFWAPRGEPNQVTGQFAPQSTGQVTAHQPAGQSAPGVTGQFPQQPTGQFAPQQPTAQFPPFGQPETTAEFSALGAATVRAFADEGASPEVHELVGRIVGRMQALEDHLSAAGQLRADISELVARLAAAASKPR